MGVCKGSVMSFAYVFPVIKICERMSCLGSVSPFFPRDSLLLYADRSWSQGGYSHWWYARSRCRGQGQEVRGPRSSKSP